MSKILCGLSLLVAGMITFAQGVTASGSAYDLTYPWPVVPADVAVKGRQSVTAYLGTLVDHVTVSFGGLSVVNGYTTVLDREWLRSNGYVHDGSFEELSSAIASVGIATSIIKTPDGIYDLWVSVEFDTADNRRCMSGYGSVSVQEDEQGNLLPGNFQPWMSVAQYMTIKIDGPVSAAKWIGPQFVSRGIATYWNGEGATSLLVTTDILNAGYLLIAGANGEVFGWDMASGQDLAGKRIIAVLGALQSSDVEVNVDPDSVMSPQIVSFYRSNGYTYGRFPLLELKLTRPSSLKVSIAVPVWGSDAKMLPSEVFITPLYLEDDHSDLKVGVEYRVNASKDMKLPPGGYNIRTQFQGLLDWGQDMYGKG